MVDEPKQETSGTITDKERAGLLMDHYKDTFGIIQGHWKARNRLFMYGLILLGLIGIDQFSPCSLTELINGYLKKKYVDTPEQWEGLDFASVNFVIRFILLCVVIQYYQRSIQVDRLYKYIHQIEERACKLLGGNFVTREGKAYFSRDGRVSDNNSDARPMFLRYVGPLYVYIFPAILSFLMAYGVGKGLNSGKTIMGLFSIVCSLAVIVYSVLYIVWVARRR